MQHAKLNEVSEFYCYAMSWMNMLSGWGEPGSSPHWIYKGKLAGTAIATLTLHIPSSTHNTHCTFWVMDCLLTLPCAFVLGSILSPASSCHWLLVFVLVVSLLDHSHLIPVGLCFFYVFSCVHCTVSCSVFWTTVYHVI